MKLFTGVVPISALALWLNLGTAIWAPADVERILRGTLTGDTLPHDSTIWWKDVARIIAILDNFTWHPGSHNKEALSEYFTNITIELTQIKGKLLSLDMAKLGIKDAWEAQIFPVKIAKLTGDISFFIDAAKDPKASLESVLLNLEIIFSGSGNQWVMKTIVKKQEYKDFFNTPLLSATFKKIDQNRYMRYAIWPKPWLLVQKKVHPIETLSWWATVAINELVIPAPITPIAKKKTFLQKLFGW